MNIKRNKKGTFDLTGVSLGKLMAIVNSVERLQNNDMGPTVVQQDVRDIIKNNPDYQKALKGE